MVDGWLKMYKHLLERGNYTSNMIWNADETFLFPGKGRVKLLGCSGGKAPLQARLDKSKHMTLHLCVSAAGKAMKPMIIFPLKRMPVLTEASANYFSGAAQAKGWMVKKLFRKWLKETFVPAINAEREQMNDPTARALLVADGHSTRADPKVLDILVENDIDCIILPAHSSSILQPLDLSVNGEFKRLLSTLYHPLQNATAEERRLYLVEQSRLALNTVLTELHICKGFTATGLWPFDKTKALGSDLVSDTPAVMPAALRSTRRRASDISATILVDGTPYNRHHRHAALRNIVHDAEGLSPGY